jgi:CBS domain-containing protein
MTAKGERRAKGERGKGKTVADVMVADVVTVEPSASLTDAARIMDQENVGMLPVVEDGRVRGVITDRDIVVRAVARGADPTTTRVQDCLTASLHLARPDWTTDEAMRRMADAQVGRLPVIDEAESLVGVVTLSSMAYRAPKKGEALEAAQEVSRRSARSAA